MQSERIPRAEVFVRIDEWKTKRNRQMWRCFRTLLMSGASIGWEYLFMRRQEFEEKIRERAYQIYLERNGEAGSETDDWLKAEQEIVASREAAVDESSEESFPASDPPAL